METEYQNLKRSFKTMREDYIVYELCPKKKIKGLEDCGNQVLKQDSKDDGNRKYIYLKKLI